jgi:carboxyl-terminal processing protease
MGNSWWNKTYTPLILALVFIVGMSVGSFFLSQNRLSIRMGKSKLDQILRFIERDYVDSLDMSELEKTAINELIENLDPHSFYITPDSYHVINDPLIGNFEGIGIQFRMIRDSLTIMLPLKGGPSLKAGLKAGDKIIIADEDTIAGKGLSSSEIIKKLKGPKGSKIDLKVKRKQNDSLLTFEVIRDRINTYTLDAAFMINDSLGYIKISRFASTTTNEFNEGLAKLLRKEMSSLILDLRGNSGGYLKSAIEMADEFLKEGELIVLTKGKNRPEKKYFAKAHGDFEKGKLIILIDENSASASEIVAGAVQDNDRGKIIGRRSYGKGLVQEVMDFADGSVLRLTVARYYTPTGRSIQRPYSNGKDSYYADHYHRGLDVNSENNPLEDTTKYFTPKGKVVYGGGGITPDITIDTDTSTNYTLYNKLARNSIIVEYSIDYYNRFYKTLEPYNNVLDFESNFQIPKDTWKGILKRAQEQNKDLNFEDEAANKATALNVFKSELARLLFGEEAFYFVYLGKDDVYKKAIEESN